MSTKLDLELERAQAYVTTLQTQKAAQDAAVATDTENVRELAVALHNLLCPLAHNGLPESCHWNEIPDKDDANQADWTERDHALWLQRARLGVAQMRALGFVVTDPDETP